MATPRKLSGVQRGIISIIAVAFSYFFIHVAYFGPPIAEIFKGVYILGTAALSILVYKGRMRPVRESFSWLDEIFAFIPRTALLAVLFLWAHWALFDQSELWREYRGAGAILAAVAGALIGAGLYYWEATRKESTDGFILMDWLFIFAAASPMIWWYFNNAELASRLGSPVPFLVVIQSGLLACVSFEIARRIVGPVIPLIGFLFMIYTYRPIAQMAPGLFFHDGYYLARITEFLILEADGMTGLIIEVFASYIVIFVVLGAFLEKTGLGGLFIDATYRLTGQRTGGPGLTAVVSSGLFGMISGSGVANVVTTGTFTIPLMKRVGYKPEFAAAVEAAASTGGAYMPPIMGAGAFLLAELTEISYFEVIKIATIPAILYYLSVGYMVYIRAVKRGLHGVPVEELPPWSRIVPRLHLLLPIPVMVYYLVIGDSAFLAAFKTIFLIIGLKILDLLAEIRTPYSERTWKPFLAISILFGFFVYYYGLKVGAPFSWFADTYRGINFGDSLMWLIACGAVLKIGEIVFAARQGTASPPKAPSSSPTSSSFEAEPPIEAGPVLLSHLRDKGVELIRVTWISLEAGAKNTLVIGCIAGVLGILLSTATQSDLPGRVSELLIEFSFGLLPLTIFWVIIAGYIVGMGLPITASYVILVIFSVVALTNLGVPTITAHLISYWVAVTSAVTPPVALAAYAASAIAVSDPVRTGFQAVKLASWIYIMPFLFVYTPLLLTGTLLDIAIVCAACLIGIVCWAGWIEGYFLRETNKLERGLLFVASICLLLPLDHFITYITPLTGEYRYPVYVAGTIMLALTFVLQRARGGKSAYAVEQAG